MDIYSVDGSVSLVGIVLVPTSCTDRTHTLVTGLVFWKLRISVLKWLAAVVSNTLSEGLVVIWYFNASIDFFRSEFLTPLKRKRVLISSYIGSHYLQIFFTSSCVWWKIVQMPDKDSRGVALLQKCSWWHYLFLQSDSSKISWIFSHPCTLK